MITKKQSRPKNHHYVPQHFLKSWGIQPKRDRLFRYRYIGTNEKFECKNVAIKKTASVDHLYDVDLPDGSFEIESSVVSPKLDEVGCKILQKARSSSIYNFTDEEKRELAIYLTCLEARHPKMLEKMDVVPDLNSMTPDDIKKNFGDDQIGKETAEYFKNIKSSGAMSLSSFIQNERSGLLCPPFSDGLLNSECTEITFSNDTLISSNYPVSRFGEYQSNLQVVVAISPRKAIMYNTYGDTDVFMELPKDILGELINIFTLMSADCGYYYDESQLAIIKNNLGWFKGTQGDEAKRYINQFIEKAMTTRDRAI